VRLVPDPLKADYAPFFADREADRAHHALVKAADKLSAYIKCVEETSTGNREFADAERILRAQVDAIDLPEVRYFLETFVPSCRRTLDELNSGPPSHSASAPLRRPT